MKALSTQQFNLTCPTGLSLFKELPLSAFIYVNDTQHFTQEDFP